MATIGFLGTGIMGAPMARHLAAAGNTVAVWNRSLTKAEPLAAHGCVLASEPRLAVEGADVVITMLSDAEATHAVMTAAAPGLSEGQRWVQMGTVGVPGTQRLAELAAQHGMVFVDAPVLGTRQPAENAQLLVIASGPPKLEAEIVELLAPVGRAVRWLGPAGAASRMKLVANSWVVGMTALLGETIGLAEALGVDAAGFLDTIKGGPLDNAYVQMKGAAMVSGDYEPQFPAQHAGKDARLCVEAGLEEGVLLRVLDAASQQFAEACRRGHADDDMAAVREAVS